MLYPRIIPCLLIKNGGLTKTVKFEDGKYVGDPINAVRIFNEKEVDELVVLDIYATKEMREPDYAMIEHLSEECRMPLCYGGGILRAEQARRIFGLGVEKVAISTAAIERPELVTELAGCVGSQSVVVVLDIKKDQNMGTYEVWTHNAERNTGKDPLDLARLMERFGAGELIINSVDRDGTMKGYDLDLVGRMRQALGIPMTVLGGAGSLDDIKMLIDRFGVIGAAAGSLFVFKGIYRAVLINYPNRGQKDALVKSALLAC